MENPWVFWLRLSRRNPLKPLIEDDWKSPNHPILYHFISFYGSEIPKHLIKACDKWLRCLSFLAIDGLFIVICGDPKARWWNPTCPKHAEIFCKTSIFLGGQMWTSWYPIWYMLSAVQLTIWTSLFVCLSAHWKKTFNHWGHRFRLVRITQQKLEKSTQHHLLKKKKKHLSLKSSIAVKIKAFKRCSPYFLVYMIIIYHNHAYMLNPIQKMREDIGTLW